MTTVIYPGTFDPITNGHLDIIERSAVLFPKFLLPLPPARAKTFIRFRHQSKIAQQAVAHLPNVEVFGFADLLAKVVQEKHIHAIIRGVRTTTDFEYELQLASLNRLLTKNENGQGVESLFFPLAKNGLLFLPLSCEKFIYTVEMSAILFLLLY